MNELKLYYIRVFKEGDYGETISTDHAYFLGDEFIVDNPTMMCVYDPDRGATEIFHCNEEDNNIWDRLLE